MMVFTNCENISTACKNKQNVLAMAVKLVSNSTTQHESINQALDRLNKALKKFCSQNCSRMGIFSTFAENKATYEQIKEV